MKSLDNSMTMDLSPRAFWGAMKEKHKRIIEEWNETQAAFEFLQGMFEYEGLPMTVRTEILEQYLLANGMVSIRKDNNGDYVAMIAECAGDPDSYGMGRQLLSRAANGQVYEDYRDSDIVAYGWNNLQKIPCMDAYRVGSYVAEIDTSLDLLVWWSRASRLFTASDNKTKVMLEEAFAALKKGVPMVVRSDNILAEIEAGRKSIESFDLSDCDFADKIDKVAYLREKRFDWFKDRYGMCARDTAKKAQVSIDEANGGTGSSMIFPLNMLRARQELINMCNRKFGWNAEVHFAGAWLGEMERYETTIIQNGEIDIDNYDATKEESGNAENEQTEDRKATESDNESNGSNAGGGTDQDGAERDESPQD